MTLPPAGRIMDVEVHPEAWLNSHSSSASPDVCVDMESEELCLNLHTEMDDPLVLLADVALAPLGSDNAICEVDSFLELSETKDNIQEMQLQLQFLLSKTDDLHNSLVNRLGHVEKEDLAAAVRSFLYTCQPYFINVEFAARSTMLFEVTKLLDLSQQLCNRLEKLLLTYGSYNIISLNEAEPNSVSPFCIGQCHLDLIRLTIFRYCEPMPYMSSVNTGLYKCMRWNVERLEGEMQQRTDKDQDGESDNNTEYYFLCFEDVLNVHTDSDTNTQDVDYVRMWYIGQWVQVDPDPDTEVIYDWILCTVPKANYEKLLFLGTDEPSCCSATDSLQQLLLS